jgi:hypothetical protein
MISAEMSSLLRMASRSKAQCILACSESIKVVDPYDKSKDEWDGTLIELSPNGFSVVIIEAKTGGGGKSREKLAFRQLEKTRELLRTRFALSYRRQRLKGHLDWILIIIFSFVLDYIVSYLTEWPQSLDMSLWKSNLTKRNRSKYSAIKNS